MKIISVSDEIYLADIYIIPKSSGEELTKYFKRKFGFDYEHDSMYGAFHYSLSEKTSGWRVNFLIFDKFENTPKGIGQFNHELSHLVADVLRSRGIEHTEATEEAYAYYTDYLSRKILDKIC